MASVNVNVNTNTNIKLDMVKKLNVILDIDDTFLKFMGDEIDADVRAYSKHDIVGKFLIRPHLEAFLNEIFAKYNVSLWTYSEKEYAMEVAKRIIDVDKHPERKLSYILSAITPDDNGKNKVRDDELYGKYLNSIWHYGDPAGDIHGNNKDLNMLWWSEDGVRNPDFPYMRECNTILIDDLLKNVINPSNYRNGISIEPFSPKDMYKRVDDNVLPQCLEILKLAQAELIKSSSQKGFEEKNVFNNHVFDIYKQNMIHRRLPASKNNKSFVRVINTAPFEDAYKKHGSSGGKKIVKA